jgi:hypothetical protein
LLVNAQTTSNALFGLCVGKPFLFFGASFRFAWNAFIGRSQSYNCG